MKHIRNFVATLALNRQRHPQVASQETGRQWRQELDALVEIAGILSGPAGFVSKCEQMLTVLAHTANADMVSLRTLDRAGTGLRLLASYAAEDRMRGTFTDLLFPLSDADCPLTCVYREGTVIVINDSTKLEKPLSDFYSPFSRSLLFCPVRVGEKAVGVLGFSSPTPYNFNPETVQLMTAITSTIGVLMENASLQEERILGDEKIVRLAQALEYTGDAIVLVDEHGNLEYMNKAAQEMTGETPLDSPDSLDDLLASQRARATKRSGGILLHGLDGGWSGEVRWLDQYGNKIDISLSTNTVMDGDNRVNGRITVGRDVTESRQIERDLLRLNKEREVEANIGRIVSSPLEMSDVFERFSEEFAEIISSDFLFITGVDLEKKLFTVNFRYRADERRYNVSKGETYIGTVVGAAVESGKSVMFNVGDAGWPAQGLERLRPLLEAGQSSFMAVPLVSQDKIVGALGLSRSGRPYTDEDQERATRIGNLIAGSLAGHLLQEATQRAEAEAEESEARFHQVADNLRGAFWLSELSTGKLLFISQQSDQIWGAPADSFYDGSVKWFDFVHPDDRERIAMANERALQTGELGYEYRIVRSDGVLRWVSSRGVPIRDENGVIYRIAGFVEDITDRKEADRRLLEAERMASIGELSAGVAHEINNPLTSIMLCSQMLLEEDLPESIRSDLQVVSSQAYRAAKIVRSLLQFARKSEPELRPLSIAGLIRRSLEMKSHEFHVNNITVVEDIPVTLPLTMLDEHLIIQVLLNVLTNAEQACVSFHGRGEIKVSVYVKEGILKVCIQDDGPGIPRDQLGKIFDPFYTTKEVGSGTGLGLSVSMGIISQHSGNIWAESTEGAGTTFHIELPSTIIDVGDTDWDFDPNPSTVTTTLKSTNHILVVDDEPDLRAILVKQFELRRYNVDQAGDGEEAWRKLQTLDYDCILLDLRMPGMSGQELYEKIKMGIPELVECIIFITGDIVNPATKDFLTRVTNPAVSKPFDFRELEQLVVGITNREKGAKNPLADPSEKGQPSLC